MGFMGSARNLLNIQGAWMHARCRERQKPRAASPILRAREGLPSLREFMEILEALRVGTDGCGFR